MTATGTGDRPIRADLGGWPASWFSGATTMRKMLPMFAVAVLFAGVTVLVRAAADEKTYKGDTECAKCTLKETKSCQNALVVEENGKKTTYYIKQNDVAKKAHGKMFCQGGKVAKVTGTVAEEDGKKILTASKIELVEE
jgi:hypothetical protein